MKRSLPFLLSFILFFLVSTTNSFGQTVVVSNNGYTVNIVVLPKAIIPTSGSCQYGYNYNVRLDYSITFSGNNIPSSLYTLQGTLGCGSSTHFFDLPNTSGVGSVTSQSNVWNPNSDCATSSVITLGCTKINIQIEGPGIPSKTVSFVVSATPLPVMLADFSAEAMKGKVKLKWSTATEENSNFFITEKSADGVNWSMINRVKAAGNSTSLLSYESYDENPLNGTSFYRLKQTDIDGKSVYSDTRSVKYTGGSIIDVYPVPNAGNTITFRGINEPSVMMMSVSDAAGASVYSAMLSSNTMQLPALKPGLYIISLRNRLTAETTNLRYIKM